METQDARDMAGVVAARERLRAELAEILADVLLVDLEQYPEPDPSRITDKD